MKKVFTGLVVLIWMLIIGSFSAQNGGESSGMSQKAAMAIAEIENAILQKNRSETQIEQRSEELQFPVRKCAHMSEYGLLAMLAVWHLGCYDIALKRRHLFAWLFATAYAVTDELHQLFVPGRSGQFSDVCFDSVGALLGILFLCICRLIYKKRKESRQKTCHY